MSQQDGVQRKRGIGAVGDIPQNQIDTLTQQLQQATATLGQRMQQLQQANATIGEQGQQLQQANATIGERTHERDVANVSYTQQTQQLEQANATIVERTQQLEQANATIVERTQQLDNIHKQISDLQTSTTLFQSRINEMKQMNDELLAYKERYEEEITQLRAENEQLKSNVKESNSQNNYMSPNPFANTHIETDLVYEELETIFNSIHPVGDKNEKLAILELYSDNSDTKIQKSPPEQPWTCFNLMDLNPESKFTGFFSQICYNAELISSFTLLTETSDGKKTKEVTTLYGVGISGPLTIAGLGEKAIEVTRKIISDTDFQSYFLQTDKTKESSSLRVSSSVKSSSNRKSIPSSMEIEDNKLPIELTAFIDHCNRLLDKAFGYSATRNDLEKEETKLLFLSLYRALSIIDKKIRELIIIEQDPRRSEVGGNPVLKLLKDLRDTVKNGLLKAKSTLDIEQASIFFDILNCKNITDIEYASADYIASWCVSEFILSMTDTTFYLTRGNQMTDPIAMTQRILRCPVWAVGLAFLPKLFDPGNAILRQTNPMFASFFNDKRAKICWEILSADGNSTNELYGRKITYAEMQQNPTFFGKVYNGSENYKRLQSRLTVKVKHPFKNSVSVTVYSLLKQLFTDPKMTFQGDMSIRLLRESAKACFVFEALNAGLTVEKLTRTKRDYLGHDYEGLINALMLLTDDMKRIVHEWGYKNLKDKNLPEFSYTSITQRSEALKNDYLLWARQLNEQQVTDITKLLYDSQCPTFKQKWNKKDDSSENMSNNTVLDECKKAYISLCTQQSEYIDPDPIGAIFGDKESWPPLANVLQEMLYIHSVITPQIYESELDCSNICTVIGYKKMEGEKNMGSGRCLFTRGNLFFDGKSMFDRVQNSNVAQTFKQMGIKLRNIPVSTSNTCLRTTDLNCTAFDKVTHNVSGPVNSADGASTHILEETGYTNSTLGGASQLYLNGEQVGDAIYSQMYESEFEVIDSYLFTSSFLLMHTNSWNMNKGNALATLIYLSTIVCNIIINDITLEMQDTFNRKFNKNYVSSFIPEESIDDMNDSIMSRSFDNSISTPSKGSRSNMTSSARGSRIEESMSSSARGSRIEESMSSSARGSIGEFVDSDNTRTLISIDEYDKVKEEKIDSIRQAMENTTEIFKDLCFCLQDSSTKLQMQYKPSVISTKLVKGILEGCLHKLVLDIDVNYRGNPDAKYLFESDIDNKLNYIRVILQSQEKTFLNEKPPEPKRSSARGRKGGANLNTSSSPLLLQSTPSLEENQLTSYSKMNSQETLQNTQPIKETMLSSPYTNDVSVPFIKPNNDLKNPIVEIYEIVNPQGEISYETEIQLFGNGSYGGYIDIINGEQVLKIFTSKQEADEYAALHLPNTQLYSNLTIDNTLNNASESGLINQNINYNPSETLQSTSFETGGYKTRRNRNKSRKMQKTIRQTKTINNRSKKHKKIIKHKKTRSDN